MNYPVPRRPSQQSIGTTALYARPLGLQTTPAFMPDLRVRSKDVYLKSRRNAGPFFWYLVAVGLILVLMVGLFASIERSIITKVGYFLQEMQDREVDKIFREITVARNDADEAIAKIVIPDPNELDDLLKELDLEKTSFSLQEEETNKLREYSKLEIQRAVSEMKKIEETITTLLSNIQQLRYGDTMKGLEQNLTQLKKSFDIENGEIKKMKRKIRHKVFPADLLIYIVGTDDWTKRSPYQDYLIVEDVRDFDEKLIRFGREEEPDSFSLPFKDYMSKVFFDLSEHGQHLLVSGINLVSEASKGRLPRIVLENNFVVKPKRIGIKIKRVKEIK